MREKDIENDEERERERERKRENEKKRRMLEIIGLKSGDQQKTDRQTDRWKHW